MRGKEREKHERERNAGSYICLLTITFMCLYFGVISGQIKSGSKWPCGV